MFPPGQPQPLGAPMGAPAQPPATMGASPLSQAQPMMPQSDPNALLAALLGGNDALGSNIIALFQTRGQNPNALGDVFSPYEPPQGQPDIAQLLPPSPLSLRQPMSQTTPVSQGPMSQMNGLPY